MGSIMEGGLSGLAKPGKVTQTTNESISTNSARLVLKKILGGNYLSSVMMGWSHGRFPQKDNDKKLVSKP